MINIVIFGPPGSGKGTQSEKLIEKYGLIHLSTGDILRSEIANGTELGVKAKAFIDAGELVPDDDVKAMVLKKFDENTDAKGFIFDGFPRTCDQARFLRHELTDRDLRINVMLTLDVPTEELISRLLKRAELDGRADDKKSIIERRIEIYHNQAETISEFYQKMHKYVPIDGMGTVDEIFERITCAVDATL